MLPKGTLYMPLNQPLKHWIQAVMGEDPFEPIEFFYDVATWSYPLHRGLAGDGFLTSQLPPGVQMTEIADPALGTRDAAPASRCTRSRPTRCRRWRWSTSCSTRASTWRRARDAFSAGGRDFTTGTALVDALARSRGVDLAALAAKRQTPVTGLDGYPVAPLTRWRSRRSASTRRRRRTPNSPLEPNAR